MDRSFDLAREFSSDHPLLLLAFSGAVSGLWHRRTTLTDVRTSRGLSPPAVACAAGVLVFYVAVAIWYTSTDQYYDLVEPSIAAVSWLVSLGASPYHDVDAASRYAHAYGPTLFLTHAGAFRLLGGEIWVSKLVGAVAGIGSLALLMRSLRSVRSLSASTVWTALCALGFLAYGNMTFWTRSDPLLVLCVTAALSAALSSRRWAAVVGVGVAIGIAANLKITGAVYVLPVLPLLRERHRMVVLPAIAAIALLTAAIPFVLLPSTALSDYWFLFRAESGTGLSLQLLRRNIQWVIYLGVPLSLQFLTKTHRANQSGLVVLMFSVSAIVVIAGTPGAGPHHLLPFIPLIVWYSASMTSDAGPAWNRRSAVAYAIPMLIIAGIQQVLFLRTIGKTASLEVSADVEAFVRAHPSDNTAMGYGGMSGHFGSAYLTAVRPLLVFHSGSYLLDAPAVQDHQSAGIGIPPSTLRALNRCDVTHWLIPRGEEPFATLNYYPQTRHPPLFSNAFKSVFHARYHLASSTRYFDVYTCKDLIR